MRISAQKATSIFILFLLSSIALASLPAKINGEPLPSLAPMLKETLPAVVNISARGEVSVPNNPLLNDPFFRFFFDLPRQAPKERTRKTQSLGSGVIFNAKEGLIVTNHHVIQQAKEISVTLNDGRQLNAQLVGSDPEADIAVIKVTPESLTQVPLANSDELQVGDFVVAIGNPFGLNQTVTSGIVSALGRSGLGIEGYEDFIQTDASINVGNSGGALVNLRGELVGINTAILAPNGGNVGIGFAIPANMVKSLVNQILEHGEVRRGLLGVTTQDFTPDLAEAFGVQNIKGALVTEISPGSAAEKAGIQSGDILVGINGRKVNSASDMRNQIGLLRAGSDVKLTVYRNGVKLSVKAKLAVPEALKVAGDELHPNFAGAILGVSEQLNERYGRPGIVVMSVQNRSPAWSTGLREGDFIPSVNRRPVSNVDEMAKAIEGSRTVLLNIRRGREAFFIVIK